VMSCNAAFNGSGRPLPGMVISASRVIFVFLPLAFMGQWLLGLKGIFAATATSNLLLALVAFYWLGLHIRAHGSEDQPRSPPLNPDQNDVRKETALPP